MAVGYHFIAMISGHCFILSIIKKGKSDERFIEQYCA
jgi:hypothetical protein